MENWYLKLMHGASVGKKAMSTNGIVGLGIGVFFIVIMAQLVESFLGNVTFTSSLVNIIKPYVVPLMFLLTLVAVGKAAGGGGRR